jgi:glycosyltransferase involved in cell wall biosynthesis
MRILNVVSNPGIGGTETLLFSMAPYIEQLGCQQEILNVWHGSMMKKPAQELGIKYFELTGQDRYIGIRDLFHVIRVIRGNNYDIICGFGLRITLLLRLMRPFFYKKPFIIGLHGIDDWRRWYHILLDRMTKWGCTMFLPNSDAGAERFMLKEKIPRKKMVVIKNGTETEKFDRDNFEGVNKQSLNLPSDKIIITTIANFRYEKGYDFYIRTIGKYLKEFKNVLFVWIGRGRLKPFLEDALRSYGCLDKVMMLEYVEDVRPYLYCSDIFVLSSREEGMPRALMEAMSMSLPCVATKVGGIVEVIENGKSGLIENFNDVDGFGEKIAALIENRELRTEIGLEARKRIVSEFDMRRIAGKYLKCLELILKGYRDGIMIQELIDQKIDIKESVC